MMEGEGAQTMQGAPPPIQAETPAAPGPRDLPGELGIKPSGRVRIPESLGEGLAGGTAGEPTVDEPVFS